MDNWTSTTRRRCLKLCTLGVITARKHGQLVCRELRPSLVFLTSSGSGSPEMSLTSASPWRHYGMSESANDAAAAVQVVATEIDANFHQFWWFLPAKFPSLGAFSTIFDCVCICYAEHTCYREMNSIGWYIGTSRKFIYHNQTFNTLFCTYYPQGRSSSYESRRGQLSVESRRLPSWCDSWSSRQDSEELSTSFWWRSRDEIETSK